MLPPLSFDASVSAETAKQDKIQVGFNHGFIVGDPETSLDNVYGEVGNFVHYLGAPPEDETETESAFGRIFRRPDRRQPPFKDQKIRKKSTPNQPLPPPLFGGFLRIQRIPEPETAWKLSSILTLNPTRFLRRQQLPTRQALFSLTPPNNYCLYHGDLEQDHDDEFALDEKLEKDNWLPQTPAWRLFSGTSLWPIHLRRYLAMSVRAVRRDIRRAAIQAQIGIVGEPSKPLTLYSAEHYWEFFSEGTCEVVRSMEPLLESYGAGPVSGQEYTVEVESGVVLNSYVLKATIQNGQVLKIYSKTDRRIRFEVSHSFNGNRPFRLPTGTVRTFSNAEAMIPLLSQLATLSADRVNDVFRHFRFHASSPGEQRSVLAFLSDFQSAVGDHEKASQLLQILIPNGSIVVGPGIEIGGRFRPELRRLVKREVLITSHYKYTVMPKYRRALRYLQDRGIDSLLGPRIRRRASPSNLAT